MQCPTCHQMMKFVSVEIQDDDHDAQSYECACGRSESIVVDVGRYEKIKAAAN
jgi:hypothetical protein